MLDNNGIKTLIKKLLPLSYIITPNLGEAEILSGIKIKTVEDVEVACEIINDYGAKNVLIKGAIIDTDLGKARITNRPSQESSVNAILMPS